jgi:hypothetical protein
MGGVPGQCEASGRVNTSHTIREAPLEQLHPAHTLYFIHPSTDSTRLHRVSSGLVEFWSGDYRSWGLGGQIVRPPRRIRAMSQIHVIHENPDWLLLADALDARGLPWAWDAGRLASRFG